MKTELVQIWRGLAVAEAFFAIGMAALVVREYLPVALKLRTAAALPLHVAMISTSYILLTLYAILTHVELFQKHAPFNWRLVVGPIAYSLGIAALTLILRDLSDRKRLGHRRRRSDP